MDIGLRDRVYWLTTMSRIAEPVLTALAEAQLKKKMPVWQGEAEWTARKAWGGNYTPIDQALLD